MKVKVPRPTTVDFETDGVFGRPDYPPVPASVSIKRWGQRPRFYAWGHASDNNCTREEAIAALKVAYETPDGLLFQNGRFDLDVAEIHLGLAPPSWDRCHDTMFLLFLDDPHQRELGLKPAAQRLLGMTPEERDAVADWLVKYQPVPGAKIGPSKQSKHPYVWYLPHAPGVSVVGPYANGDVVRTEAIFAKLYPSIVERGMLEAYDRERRLTPILLDMERRGIRVDLDRLRADVAVYQGWRVKIEAWVRKRLGVGQEVNLQSGDQLLAALQEANLVDVTRLGLTKGGKLSTTYDSLKNGLTDPVLAAMLRYDAQLKTCLTTFMEPWLATAERSGGLIFTTWHQTRSPDGGARTGRFSSSPNFQNMPKEFDPIWYHERAREEDPVKARVLPRCPLKGLPSLPLCRGYVIPYHKDHVLIGRDYSQQEPRILAHFEDGDLKDQYVADPWIDYHDNAKEQLERVFRRPFKRKPVKVVNLGLIYGQGIASLALKNGESYELTKELRDAIYALYPGLKEMNKDMKRRAIAKEPIRTWGGREYYCEPPMIVKGRIMTFDYKLVNVLVQGSAADCTKEAVIRFYTRKPDRWHLLLSVHDELVLSAPACELMAAQELLRDCMESVEFDVLIKSEGVWSATSWATMENYDVKGVVVAKNLPPQKVRKDVKARIAA